MKYRREFIEPAEFNEDDRVYGRTILHCSQCNSRVVFDEVMELDIYEKYFKKILEENKKLKGRLDDE